MENDNTCFHCGGGGKLLQCHFCSLAYHASCCSINGKVKEWKCPECIKEDQQSNSAAADTIAKRSAAIALSESVKLTPPCKVRSPTRLMGKAHNIGKKVDNGSDHALHDAVSVWSGVGAKRKQQDAVIVNDDCQNGQIQVQLDTTEVIKWVNLNDVQKLPEGKPPKLLRVGEIVLAMDPYSQERNVYWMCVIERVKCTANGRFRYWVKYIEDSSGQWVWSKHICIVADISQWKNCQVLDTNFETAQLMNKDSDLFDAPNSTDTNKERTLRILFRGEPSSLNKIRPYKRPPDAWIAQYRARLVKLRHVKHMFARTEAGASTDGDANETAVPHQAVKPAIKRPRSNMSSDTERQLKHKVRNCADQESYEAWHEAGSEDVPEDATAVLSSSKVAGEGERGQMSMQETRQRGLDLTSGPQNPGAQSRTEEVEAFDRNDTSMKNEDRDTVRSQVASPNREAYPTLGKHGAFQRQQEAVHNIKTQEQASRASCVVQPRNPSGAVYRHPTPAEPVNPAKSVAPKPSQTNDLVGAESAFTKLNPTPAYAQNTGIIQSSAPVYGQGQQSCQQPHNHLEPPHPPGRPNVPVGLVHQHSGVMNHGALGTSSPQNNRVQTLSNPNTVSQYARSVTLQQQQKHIIEAYNQIQAAVKAGEYMFSNPDTAGPQFETTFASIQQELGWLAERLRQLQQHQANLHCFRW